MNRIYSTNKPGKAMKLSNPFVRVTGFLVIALLGIFSVNLQAADEKPAVAQKTFASGRRTPSKRYAVRLPQPKINRLWRRFLGRSSGSS